MNELFPDITAAQKILIGFQIDRILLSKKSLFEMIKELDSAREKLPEDQKVFFDFYFNLRMEQEHGDNNNKREEPIG